MDSPEHPIIPVAGWPGLYVRHSLPRFLAACVGEEPAKLADDLVPLVLASVEALVAVEGGELADLGEALGCDQPVQFGSEIAEPLGLQFEGHPPRDDRERVLALFGGADAEVALHQHVQALGARAEEFLNARR